MDLQKHKPKKGRVRLRVYLRSEFDSLRPLDNSRSAYGCHATQSLLAKLKLSVSSVALRTVTQVEMMIDKVCLQEQVRWCGCHTDIVAQLCPTL